MNDYKIILDKERTLRFSNRSFMELDNLTGKSIVSIFTDATQELTPTLQQKKLIDTFSRSKFIVDFIYCGLLHEKELTYEQVIDIIPPSKNMDIMTLALEVLPTEYGMIGNAKNGKKKMMKVV